MTVGECKNPEKESFFIRLARQSGQRHRYDYSWCHQGYGCKVKPDKNNSRKWIVEFDEKEHTPNVLNAAKELLEAMTKLYPPGKGERGKMRHNLTLNGDKLELNLMFNDEFQSILITDDGIVRPIELIIEEIKASIEARLVRC